MPKDNSIKSVLIIGSGPIVIGQACEFDYAGSQSARSIREEGIEVILINSNPATIMTDPSMADHIYLLPLTTKSIIQILKEHPQIDAVLPTMGGQTALNLCLEANDKGIWKDFNVKMMGQSKSGEIVIKESPVHVVLWTPAKVEEGMRYSIIYEFNKSKAITIYEKYLTEVIAPKIPTGATVIIHGHTDVIGEEAYNQDLSLARANDVKSIIESGLSNTGRNDVKFELHGFGEDENKAPFENKTPEERSYNRTVIIDIIPATKLSLIHI